MVRAQELVFGGVVGAWMGDCPLADLALLSRRWVGWLVPRECSAAGRTLVTGHHVRSCGPGHRCGNTGRRTETSSAHQEILALNRNGVVTAGLAIGLRRCDQERDGARKFVALSGGCQPSKGEGGRVSRQLARVLQHYQQVLQERYPVPRVSLSNVHAREQNRVSRTAL